jgi:hypothetical protein
MLTSLLNFMLNNQIILEETPPIPTNFSPTHFCYQGEYLQLHSNKLWTYVLHISIFVDMEIRFILTPKKKGKIWILTSFTICSEFPYKI